jgi:hypothetical protein
LAALILAAQDAHAPDRSNPYELTKVDYLKQKEESKTPSPDVH